MLKKSASTARIRLLLTFSSKGYCSIFYLQQIFLNVITSLKEIKDACIFIAQSFPLCEHVAFPDNNADTWHEKITAINVSIPIIY